MGVRASTEGRATTCRTGWATSADLLGIFVRTMGESARPVTEGRAAASPTGWATSAGVQNGHVLGKLDLFLYNGYVRAMYGGYVAITYPTGWPTNAGFVGTRNNWHVHVLSIIINM